MLCHALGMVSIFPLNVLAPFILFLLKDGEIKGIRKHAYECLNFQMTVSCFFFVFVLLFFLFTDFSVLERSFMSFLGFGIMVIGLVSLFLFNIMMSLEGVKYAKRGEVYKYPLSFLFIEEKNKFVK